MLKCIFHCKYSQPIYATHIKTKTVTWFTDFTGHSYFERQVYSIAQCHIVPIIFHSAHFYLLTTSADAMHSVSIHLLFKRHMEGVVRKYMSRCFQYKVCKRNINIYVWDAYDIPQRSGKCLPWNCHPLTINHDFNFPQKNDICPRKLIFLPVRDCHSRYAYQSKNHL